jgi:hypothetical protein
MSCLMNFSVLCGELGEWFSLFPNAYGKIACFIATQPHQPPLGCSLTSPCSEFSRSRESSVVEFAHCVADGPFAATQFIDRFSHAESNHAVVAAVVAINELKQQASGIGAEAVIGRPQNAHRSLWLARGSIVKFSPELASSIIGLERVIARLPDHGRRYEKRPIRGTHAPRSVLPFQS